MTILKHAVRFLKSDDGPAAVEYVTLVALILLVMLAAITALGGMGGSVWAGNRSAVENAFNP